MSREALLVDGEGDTDGATDASGVPQGIGDEATARYETEYMLPLAGRRNIGLL